MTDGNGHTTTYEYDARNLKAKSTDALETVTNYGYDGAGNVSSMMMSNPSISGSASMTYGYDALNRQTKITDAAGKLTQYQYDLGGNVTKMTDARGNVTETEYKIIDHLNQRCIRE
jgi:YD repeat-containing protein